MVGLVGIWFCIDMKQRPFKIIHKGRERERERLLFSLLPPTIPFLPSSSILDLINFPDKSFIINKYLCTTLSAVANLNDLIFKNVFFKFLTSCSPSLLYIF